MKLTQGLAVSLHAQYSWTIPNGAWTHRRALFRGEPEELVRVFHSERLRQKALERAGHCSPKWTVLRSFQQVYGARNIRGCTIIDAPPLFQSEGREESADLMNRDTTGEGSVPNQEERGPPIFWGNNQGPLVTVRAGRFRVNRRMQRRSSPTKMTGLSGGSREKAERTSEHVSRGGFTRRERMVPHQRYPNDDMFSGHGDLGP